MIRKLTPVVIVDHIEPLLPFYVDALGFAKVVEVPGEGRLGFVMLLCGEVELMFQTADSVRADTDKNAKASPACLYFNVDDLDRVISALRGAPIVVPRRTAPYGADEIFVKDPAGNTVGFAVPPSR